MYIAIAVGVSDTCTTRAREMAGILAIYFLCTAGWVAHSINPVVLGTFIVGDPLGFDPVPHLYDVVFALSSSFAYERATAEFLGMRTISPGSATAADTPFYLGGVFMLVLALWMVAPLGIGYLRFRTLEVS